MGTVGRLAWCYYTWTFSSIWLRGTEADGVVWMGDGDGRGIEAQPGVSTVSCLHRHHSLGPRPTHATSPELLGLIKPY